MVRRSLSAFMDIFAYTVILAGILEMTRPRYRPPLYLDRNGVFHWTSRGKWWTPYGRLIEQEMSLLRDMFAEIGWID